MQRRTFLKNNSMALAGFGLGLPAFSSFQPFKDQIIGHGTHQYKIDLNWGALNSTF